MPARKSGSTSGKNGAGKTSPPASTTSKRSITLPSEPHPPLDDKLDLWLKEQVTKLNDLNARSNRLKFDFVQNATEKGKLLLEVQDRLKEAPLSFRSWVVKETDIGYSTALLWIDVAQNPDVIKKRFVDSNPLEFSLRQARDAIKEQRQSEGGGKPGSGRKMTATAETSEVEGDHSEDPADQEARTDADVPAEPEVAADPGNEVAPNKKKWEREVAKAESEAAKVNDGGTTDPERAQYKVTVMVFSESDEAAIHRALSQWSATTKGLGGSKQLRSVSAKAQPNQIGTLMQKLAAALVQKQPRKVRVSIEL